MARCMGGGLGREIGFVDQAGSPYDKYWGTHERFQTIRLLKRLRRKHGRSLNINRV